MVLSAGYAPIWEFESDEIAAILACLKAIQGRCTTVRAEDFIISKRPRLGSITKHRKIEFTDYERAVIVLEGWDTAGKGGIVRRLGWVLDPRSFKVHPISAPSSHERGKHYLQRFWEKLPEHGQIVVFDRSWYGRVLVERVEGFATKRQWRRGYEEINQFERLLVEDGIRTAKIFLHISAGEQIRRFKDRINNPLKRWKLSYEDFRNRERWADYEIAIEDMIEKTSTKRAPWYLVPTNDKLFGRIAAFTILIDRLGKGVNLKPRPLDPEIAARAAQLFDLS